MRLNRVVWNWLSAGIAIAMILPAEPVGAECLDCHSAADMTKVGEDGKEISLYVNHDLYLETPHGSLGCTDCHSDLAGMEDGHGAPVEKVACGNCHFDVGELYNTSIHGQLRSKGNQFVADCASCHGKHDILPASDARSRINGANLENTCGACHANKALEDAQVMSSTEQVQQFHESIHGQSLRENPDGGAPTCSNCHGYHDIQNASNPGSPIHRLNVSQTCGQCHGDVLAVYEGSIHGSLNAAGRQEAPSCIQCHESHNIIAPNTHAFKVDIDEKCGACHGEMLKGYHETFHGKAMKLGADNVAACYDCHGYHDIVAVAAEQSPVHPDNRTAMCQKCHPQANDNFAGFIAHADYLDREKYPQLFWPFVFMTSLLLGVFLFFGTHTALWFSRSLRLMLHDSKKFFETKRAVKTGSLIVGRFTKVQRGLHLIMVISFMTLVITGLPLKFFATGWASWVMDRIGGVAVAGVLHRTAALLLLGIFIFHVIRVAGRLARKTSELKAENPGKSPVRLLGEYLIGPDSLIPVWKDVRELIAHTRWFLGAGERPRFDRWTYWEKFDYFAVFWGVVIIGGSGLILWFPEFFTQFLPGWTINVALIVHSDEALLAAGFIFTIHFFNNHFRLEKLPMDTAIFSGRISEEELKEERPAWYERLRGENQLESLRLKEPGQEKLLAYKIFGFCAVIIGNLLTLAILIGLFVTWFSH